MKLRSGANEADSCKFCEVGSTTFLASTGTLKAAGGSSAPQPQRAFEEALTSAGAPQTV
jgi:hypothetical protein